jgi:16S rRNA (cytosine967-C5)-methyltransferase
MDGKLPFDVVLVDAPCTGLGVVRRKPEIRWRRMESDVFDSSVKQLVILSNASKQVANGGRLVYTVCSPEPEEGQEVVQAFMTQNPEFSLQDTILTAPPTCGEDAHFGAVLVRT